MTVLLLGLWLGVIACCSSAEQPAREFAESLGDDSQFQQFLAARGSAATSPTWADLPHSERTANLLRHLRPANLLERRRMQWPGAPRAWADDSAEAREADAAAALGSAGAPWAQVGSSTCGDSLAANTDQPPPCTYDCSALADEYLGSQPAAGEPLRPSLRPVAAPAPRCCAPLLCDCAL